MRTATLLLFIALIAGCAGPTYYVHNTKGPGQFAADRYDCENIAAQRTANYGSSFAGNPLIIADEMKKCLTLKYGWHEQAQAPYSAPSSDDNY